MSQEAPFLGAGAQPHVTPASRPARGTVERVAPWSAGAVNSSPGTRESSALGRLQGSDSPCGSELLPMVLRLPPSTMSPAVPLSPRPCPPRGAPELLLSPRDTCDVLGGRKAHWAWAPGCPRQGEDVVSVPMRSAHSPPPQMQAEGVGAGAREAGWPVLGTRRLPSRQDRGTPPRRSRDPGAALERSFEYRGWGTGVSSLTTPLGPW